MPRCTGFLESCTPHIHLASITGLSASWLHAHGIEAVLSDLDNTLVPYGCKEVSVLTRQYVAGLLAAGLRVIVLSNAGPRRVAPVAEALGVPFLAHAGKPARGAYERALSKLGAGPEAAVGVGDQVLRDVLGARRSGLLSVLVDPLSPRDFPGTTLLRGPERALIAHLRRLDCWPNAGLPDGR
jgi:HAD superfamily phosphatase (TIGR01668 family)